MRKQEKQDVDIHSIYLKDICKYGDIDDAKTREYLEIYRHGSEKERKSAKKYIVGSHQRYVLSIANKYANRGNFMDIISEGNIGLMTAIEKYDTDSEAKFTTYAMYWIRKVIIDYITLNEPMVTPNNAVKLATYVPKAHKEFWEKNLRHPTTDELQEILSRRYSLNFANKEDLIAPQTVSIDENYGEDEDGQEFMETNEYTSKTATCNTDELTNKSDTKIILDKLLSRLSKRDAYVVRRIYGIDCFPRTMNDVASEIGISYERVRQIVIDNVAELGKKHKKLISFY